MKTRTTWPRRSAPFIFSIPAAMSVSLAKSTMPRPLLSTSAKTTLAASRKNSLRIFQLTLAGTGSTTARKLVLDSIDLGRGGKTGAGE